MASYVQSSKTQPFQGYNKPEIVEEPILSLTYIGLEEHDGPKIFRNLEAHLMKQPWNETDLNSNVSV